MAVVPLCLVAAWPLSAVQSQQPISHFDWHVPSAAWPLSVFQSRQPVWCILCSLASVSTAILSLRVMRTLCNLTSLCSSVFDICLSLLCCWAAALSSVVLAARLALSLILRFLNLSSLCSAVSEALRALSLSLLRRSLLSVDSEDLLELESIFFLMRTSIQCKSTRGNEMLQIVKLEHANCEYTPFSHKIP